MRNHVRILCCLVALAATILLSPGAAATATYTATGSVEYGSGEPVSGRTVSVRYAWLTGAHTQTVATNSAGGFSVSWTGASSVVFYVTITVEGAANSVTGTSSRQINWNFGGTRNFGVWTVLGGPPGPAGDVDRDGIPDAEEDRLLQKFAPQVRLHSADWNRPANVDWVLPRSHMNYSHLGGFLFFGCNDHGILAHGTPTYGTGTSSDITEQQHQSASGWPGCNDTGPYHRSDAHSPGSREGFFLQQYNSSHSGAGSPQDWKVYGHVYPHSTNRIVVQYWFFYPYNDGFLSGNHESDWEHVLFVVEPLNGDAVIDVRYSQHDSPRKYDWNQIAKVNGHPVIYSAKGSHANYAFHEWAQPNPLVPVWADLCERSFSFLGQKVDYCNDAGTWWNTWDTQTYGGVVNIGESHFTMSADWLRYSGRWGEIGVIDVTSGKKGPAYQPSYWRYCGSPEFCDNGIDDDVDGVVDEPQCSTLADLTVEDLDPTVFGGGFPGSVLVAPGDSLHVTGKISNEGGTAATAFTTRVALSSDDAYDDGDPELLAVTLPGLIQHTLSALDTDAGYQIPPLLDGVYYLVAKTDTGGAVAEGFEGEDNNTAASEFVVEVDSGALRLDNFDDGVADGFVPYQGSWDATGGSYMAQGYGSDDNATVSLLSSPEGSVTLEFDFWVTDDGVGTQYQPYLGAILRYQDATHFLRVDTYRLSDGNSYVRLLGWNGTFDVISSSQLMYAVDQGLHHMMIEDRGCQIAVFLDGLQVLSGSYDGPVPQGSRGLFVNVATKVGFDNFRIRRLEDLDNDGWNAACGDCDDANYNVNPGRTENCYTSYDDDCDGTANEGCSGGHGGGCFSAGTEIVMADGTTRPIESILPGDLVLSYDAVSQAVVPGTVIHTVRHDPPESLVVIDGSLRATPNHELLTNGAWLPLDGLMERDALTRLVLSSGEPSESTTRQEPVRTIATVPGDAAIYDIEVSNQHNYFAGGVLVHNKVIVADGGRP